MSTLLQIVGAALVVLSFAVMAGVLIGLLRAMWEDLR